MLKLDTRSQDFETLLQSIPRETIAMVGDAPLTIPVEVPSAVGLGYARTRLNRGDEIAITWAMELLLGRDGFSLLIGSTIDDAGMDTVMDLIVARIRGASTGAVDAGPKATSTASPGTRKRVATPARSRGAKK